MVGEGRRHAHDTYYCHLFSYSPKQTRTGRPIKTFHDITMTASSLMRCSRRLMSGDSRRFLSVSTTACDNRSPSQQQIPHVPTFTNTIQPVNIASMRRHFSTATRRRRRGTRNSPMTEEPQSTTTPQIDNLSSERFETAAQQLFNQIEKSVDKLKECNDGLELQRFGPRVDNSSYSDENETDHFHRGQILIHIPPSGDAFWGGGTYKLTIHAESIDGVDRLYSGYVSMQSPLSGTFTYVYNVRTGEWEGTEDGHALLGMFTRDFIRQCQGVPDF